MLTVPAPQLTYEALSSSVAALELPLTVTVGPVLLDSAPQTPVELSTFSLVGYRQPSALSAPEVWDPAARQWLAEGSAVADTPLAYLPAQPAPWQGTIVAAVGQDASGQPQFVKAIAGYPSYWFRALFADGEEVALSGPSDSVTFGGINDRNLLVLGPGEGEEPKDATEARLLLKNPGRQVIGSLVIRRDSPGAEMTLSNAAGASAVLKPDGSIELHPAVGRRVVVAGDLETERVIYRPAAGGTKKTLV
ncbi:hypothetical protein A5724_19270 [Mycobacterium sp. ACS1612]|uniref:hypothetical protein n=1 Tax=Mycobacterium sp. ACS1612 TaxID=1834117 RepID=UPI0007FE0AAB|nr:hypothetical protein [Mycobacterium sp. ACS1612]OBF33692.1 hypothetical protein A5724_19270 [Mycobacterium sp. ACS1612]